QARAGGALRGRCAGRARVWGVEHRKPGPRRAAGVFGWGGGARRNPALFAQLGPHRRPLPAPAPGRNADHAPKRPAVAARCGNPGSATGAA
nr:hypothetical protein [Tanacetum cinerariifolium]